LKNVLFVSSLLFNCILILFLLREKGGCNYVCSKFNKDKPVVREHGKEYWKLKAMYASMPRVPNSIVFVGNSLTRDCDWAEMFQIVTIRNRGIGGDCAAGVLERIDEILDPPPQKIFIEVGLSDLARGFSQKEIVSILEKIIDTARIKSPHVQLYVQSILPVREGLYSPHPFGNKEIIELNKRFQDLAQRMNCTYINLYPHFLGSSGEIDSSVTKDGVHINAKGYSVWKKQVAPFVLPSTL
jgi:lysophospholipase L1-like esterase